MNLRKLAATAATTALCLAPAALTSSASAADQDGPHASLTRHAAATTSTIVGDTRVISYDLGNTDLGSKKGQFVAPVRGTLITPAHPHGATKLIIISHLRTSGCADGSFAYPCPGGKERRLDQGMTYLGEALAKQGYTVLIPDLAPLWIGTTLQAPYNQTAGWLKIMDETRDALASDDAGKSTHFGMGLAGTIDMSRAGLLVHSRSGFIAGPAVTAWAKGPTKIASVLAYGPAYDVPDANNNVTAAISPTVPYLGLVGTQDNDVPFNADMWLGNHIEQQRSAPAIVATVPGLGHDAINTTLSSAGIDDRLNCTPSTCASPAAHRAFLTSVASDYFNATLTGAKTTLPLTASAAFPAKIGGLSAQWMAVTNTPQRVTLFSAATAKSPATVSAGSTMKLCSFYDPQDPTPYANACPDTGNGSVMMIGSASHVALKKGGSMTFATQVRNATSVDVQITPYGDRTDGLSSSQLTVDVVTADGVSHAVTVPASASAALNNRATSDANGTYVMNTMRIPLPASLASQTITAVRLSAPHGGSYALGGVEIVGQKVSAVTPTGSATTTKPATTKPTAGKPSATPTHTTSSTPTHSTSSTTGSTGSTGKTTTHHATGPIIQTDHVLGTTADMAGDVEAAGVAAAAAMVAAAGAFYARKTRS